jgi:hypothetical protein
MVKISLLLVLAAAVIAGRWATRRRDAIGRPRRFPYVSVVGLVIVAVVGATPTYLRHHEENRLSAVATDLVGAKAVVHCQTLGEQFVDVGPELGYVRWGPGGVPEHQTLIKRGPCGALRDYDGSTKAHPSAAEVIAVHVLTHESMHMRGITSESAAECAAVQRDATTAELLGAKEPDAVQLARTYWLTDYPRMPDGYRTTSCAPGGSLDEHLPHPPWAPAS